MQERLLANLDYVARRFRRLRAWKGLTISSLCLAIFALLLLGLAVGLGWGARFSPLALGVVAVVVIGLAAWLGLRSVRDPHWVAGQIESVHPELETLLLAALEQRPDLPDGKFGFLQEDILRRALDHAEHHDWSEACSTGRLRKFQWAGIATLVLLAAAISGLAVHAGQHGTDLHVPLPFAFASRQPDYQLTVHPGDTQIQRGASLVVTARFPADLPDGASLVYRDDSEQPVRMTMSRSLSDPVFGGRVADVRADLAYRVEYAGLATRDYRVTVYELPELQRADVELEFPGYTRLQSKRVEDTRRITAVEGTKLTLFCQLNKPVKRAELVGEDSETIQLARADEGSAVYSMSLTLDTSGRYKLRLVDDDGRQNKLPPEFVFRATPNQPPDVKMAFPSRDVRVSPIEELETAASVWDDFGLRAFGLKFQLAGGDSEEVVLGELTPRNERLEAQRLIDFEALEAEPDELLSYYYWAEDFGPDGQPRRTLGDMYFAEVRHFEEIFRQGDQPPGGAGQQGQPQGGNAQEAEELAEMQKQIINATWTVIRREIDPEPTKGFKPDVDKILQSQQELLVKVGELASKIQDPQSQQHVLDVQQNMNEAVKHLTEATQSDSPQALDPALGAEQAAYQAMLRLRAREHRVTRGRPQQSQQASSSASGRQSRAQQQLEQLQLKNSENRYETERQAQSQQDAAQQETLQVLNRLRELARRQNDLNQQLKELQSALEQAKTEQEREEIERQLQRLRDEQERILRDVDELAERMERPENQERMAQSRENLEQTRQNVRQASEALQQGQVSQAVAEGTRAERDLRQMQEEFRKEAAGRFSDEVTQLRDDARELDENQRELAEELSRLDQAQEETRRLRDESNREEIVEGLREQGEDLESLLGQMQETVEEAEETEPLLARQLYDTLRRTRQNKVDDALDVARQMLDQGIVEETKKVESLASKGIRRLREDVEKAAESVLGDEGEALRRAHDVLTQLADELERELAMADPETRPQTERDRSARRSGEPREPRQENEDRARRSDEPEQRPPGPQQGSQSEDEARRQQENSSSQTAREQSGQPQEGQSTGRPSDGDRQPTEAPTAPRYGGLRDRQDTPRQEGLTPRDLSDAFPEGPFGGDEFLRWSDRLREAEEMVNDPDLRAEAARIRDRARGIRRDFVRRRFEAPNWDLVRDMVAEPLNELRDRVGEELLRLSGTDSLVPIDRDPVPPQYAEQVRRYYEELGRGE